MRRLLILTCSIVLVDTVFHSALVPLIPYFTDELGLSKAGVGVLSGAFGAGVLVGSIPGGYLVTRVGVKPAALAGFAIFSVTSVIFGFAGEGWLLVLARLGEGFGSALSWVAAFTWLVRAVSEERRGEAIGTLMSSAVVGALLGPVVGSVAAVAGIAVTFSVVAVLGLLLAAWIWHTPSPPTEEKVSFLPSLRKLVRPNLAAGMAFVTFSPLLFGAPVVLAPLGLDALGWGAVAIGAVFLVAAAFEAFIQPLLGRWSDSAGFGLPTTVALVGSLVLLLLFPFAGSALFLAGLVVLAAVFFNGTVTPGTALFSRSADKAGVAQAIVFGATNFAWATGSAVGAPLAGILADIGGDALAYIFLTVICVLAMFLLRRVVST